jgi:protein-histidine pros-kinase
MGLRAKFNLAVFAAFAVGLAVAGVVLQQLFIQNAREEVLQNARIMMSAADAVRQFTSEQVEPLAARLNSGRFIAASVPSFAAQTTFKDVQKQFPDYAYREPTLNPTNPADRPSDWEADYINGFRNKTGTKELVGQRDTPTGPSLSLARPIVIDSPECLTCHSIPGRAPPPMLATYGLANGFGWQMHEVVGAQVVSVPMSVPLQTARQTFLAFMAIMAAMFVLVMLILNVLLHYMVIRPVVKVARIANAVSLGEPDVEEYDHPGRDEIAVLSAAFNRMRRSLDSALRLLEP